MCFRILVRTVTVGLKPFVTIPVVLGFCNLFFVVLVVIVVSIFVVGIIYAWGIHCRAYPDEKGIETPMSPGRGSHVTDGKPDILIRPC